ncbi:class I SAM-dependent methyltransferase [Pseudonocardia humida]|uniref:Class I SAM-dependent methyltransferase n=1 Tax=Pseudonocardia humida TaxID=2800819 RepID=A0ABT0ZUN2_9PSEU|nr:class I SAM-dependent methyltransferase [Pseudonocardia humida]MCO1654428.1 class I SAM-dependent methyltransferase [Pseudonocardia humida]
MKPVDFVPGFDPGWLAAREPADHAARAADLAAELAGALRAAGGELVVHDLGSGTGSLARWLAPRLPGPQRWVLHDRDPRLLQLARRRTAELTDADGGAVRVDTATGDLTALRAADLAGASAVTASALLDLLTAAEVDALAAACAGAGCPVLWTLSVTGDVRIDPPDPLDDAVTAAFNAHQRRPGPGGALLGPDAADATARALRRHGMVVREAETPWRLDAGHPEMLDEWLRGRAAAAVEQEPGLAAEARRWLADRLAAVADRGLTALVSHRDLLAVPDRLAPAGPRPSEVAP